MEEEAEGAVETARRKLAALKAGNLSLSHRVDEMEDILLSVIAACQHTHRHQHCSFTILLLRIRQMQEHIDSLMSDMASPKEGGEG